MDWHPYGKDQFSAGEFVWESETLVLVIVYLFDFFVGFLSVLNTALWAKALVQILNKHHAFACSPGYFLNTMMK